MIQDEMTQQVKSAKTDMEQTDKSTSLESFAVYDAFLRDIKGRVQAARTHTAQRKNDAQEAGLLASGAAHC